MPENNILEKWSSLKDVADHLGVSQDTVRLWIKDNKIPAHKIGKQWKFKLSEIGSGLETGMLIFTLT